MKTFQELEAFVRQHFPGGSLEEDNSGQLVIYTGLTEHFGDLEEFSDEEER